MIPHSEYLNIIKPNKILEHSLKTESKDKNTPKERKKEIKEKLLPAVRKKLEPYNDQWFTDESPLAEAMKTGILKFKGYPHWDTEIKVKIL